MTDFNISHDSPLPLHLQLLDELRHRVKNGLLKPHDRLPGEWELVEKLKEVGSRHDITAGVVALAWVLAHPAVTGVISGARSIRQIEDITPALDFRLTQEEVAEIEAFQKAQQGT